MAVQPKNRSKTPQCFTKKLTVSFFLRMKSHVTCKYIQTNLSRKHGVLGKYPTLLLCCEYTTEELHEDRPYELLVVSESGPFKTHSSCYKRLNQHCCGEISAIFIHRLAHRVRGRPLACCQMNISPKHTFILTSNLLCAVFILV